MKKVKTKFENLQKLGVAEKEKAWEWANIEKGECNKFCV